MEISFQTPFYRIVASAPNGWHNPLATSAARSKSPACHCWAAFTPELLSVECSSLRHIPPITCGRQGEKAGRPIVLGTARPIAIEPAQLWHAGRMLTAKYPVTETDTDAAPNPCTLTESKATQAILNRLCPNNGGELPEMLMRFGDSGPSFSRVSSIGLRTSFGLGLLVETEEGKAAIEAEKAVQTFQAIYKTQETQETQETEETEPPLSHYTISLSTSLLRAAAQQPRA